jgi:hypothetical protein
VTRWKAIGLLAVSIALLASSCPGDAEEDKAKADEEFNRQSQQRMDDAAAQAEADAAQAEADAAQAEVEAAQAEADAAQAEDETLTGDLNGTYQNGENDDHGDGCDDPAAASDRQVKVKTVIPGVDAAGDLGFNVHMCEPVDPMNPFGHLYSGFFLCPPWFGFEIHTGVWTVLGNAVGASTLVDGSFWFPMGAPPPNLFPLEFICDHASWHLMEDPVIPGQSSPHLHGNPAIDLDAAKAADTADPYRQFP